MTNVLLYTAITSLTIVSPGPGILLTLSNTLNYHIKHALWGIVGVVAGMACIGFIASSSLGASLNLSEMHWGKALFERNDTHLISDLYHSGDI